MREAVEAIPVRAAVASPGVAVHRHRATWAPDLLDLRSLELRALRNEPWPLV